MTESRLCTNKPNKIYICPNRKTSSPKLNHKNIHKQQQQTSAEQKIEESNDIHSYINRLCVVIHQW